jgi:LmbE family N-acetylglucosaminyl deacetylase
MKTHLGFSTGHRWLCALAAIALAATTRAAEPAPGAALLQDLKSFSTVGTVLHVGAHPDDENTQLITYFARGRGYRTAYLSVTRGDGGQNEIGPEFDEKLGVARTQELLAARRLDGGRQFFTRAIDFGFSKTPEETLGFWDREQVLGDVVRVIRKFRPDVIVTRFPIPPGSGGHGHHTASGILGVEAFKIAGDPKAFPEQIAQGLKPWQPKRVVWNGFGPGRGGGPVPSGPQFKTDIGGNDPVTGESFASISARSRGQHITQGFGNFAGRGRGPQGGPSVQTFTILGGDLATDDLMEGVDTTWARYPGGAEIGRMAGEIIAKFDGNNPAASIDALLALRKQLATMPSDPVVDDKRQQLDGIIERCLGLQVKTLSPTPEALAGEAVKLTLNATVQARVPVKWISVKSLNGVVNTNVALTAGQTATRDYTFTVPANTPLTHPYWLREEGSSGMARVADPKLIGEPENPPALPFEYTLEVGGQTFVIVDEAVNIGAPGGKGPARRKLDVIPPVSLAFSSDVALVPPGKSKAVSVIVTAARAGASGTLQIESAPGWQISPANQSFKLAGVGEKATLTFTVTAPPQATAARFTARATIDGKAYTAQRVEIRYDHIPVQLLQSPVRLRAVSFEVAKKGSRVGYLPGAGDDTAEALEQLGYEVTTLSGADLTPAKLSGLDAVLIGVRAFNERTDLAANLPGLFSYVEAGGVVIAQYNRPNGLKATKLGPYDLSIEGRAEDLRVTDEKAAVSFIAPEHPALTVPNRIGPADFNGWVQERGTYFPSKWDPHYETILAMSDPGEAPLKSSLLIAPYGRGYYVYAGLTFFRQLPAGVPGAYRLLANLVSLGK